MSLRLEGYFRSSHRKRLLSVAVYAVGLLIAYRVAQYILNDDLSGFTYAGLLIVGGAVVIKILNNWRAGVYLFLTWLLFEDLSRKFLRNDMAIYFAKDFLLLVVLISFVRAIGKKTAKTFRPPFLVPLLIFVWFGLLQIFNPASTSIVYGLMGFKLFFYYIPLVFVGYALVDSEVELRRFFVLNLVLGLIIISLGTAQSILGPSFLNPEKPADDLRELSTLYRVAPDSGALAYRPTSVFVSAGRYSNFIMVAWLLVLGFTGYLLLRSKRGRSLAFVGLVLTAAGALLTASRGTFMSTMINAAITGGAFVWGTPWRQRGLSRVLRTMQRAALGTALAFVLLLFIFPEALSSRLDIYRETLLPSSSHSELGFRTWNYPIQNFLKAFSYDRWFYGYGIGTTGLGGQYVARFFHATPPVAGVESGFGTLVVEMGIGGLILWFVMGIAILASAWKEVKKLKGSPWFPLAFVIFWYAFILLFPATYGGMQPYEDFLLNAYFWLLLGLLFRLPTLALPVHAQANPAARPSGLIIPRRIESGEPTY